MTKIRIGTFNTYNLFTRYKFKGKKKRFPAPPGSNKKYTYKWVPYSMEELFEAVENGFSFHKDAFGKLSQNDRELTAKVIESLNAEILAVQEVESLDTLKFFNSRHLSSNHKYKYNYLIAGNDIRGIDIGLLSKFEADFVRTHQFDRNRKNDAQLFSRDCLEVHYLIDGRPLVILVNHLKSMFGGRSETRDRRYEQSEAVIDILKDLFGSNYGNADFVVLGDMNDYVDEEELSGITPLTTSNQMEDVVSRLPRRERWTYYYHKERAYNQIDYLFLSKSIAERNPDVLPIIERRGMSKNINQPNQHSVQEEFFAGVTKKVKASDHAGVAITIDF